MDLGSPKSTAEVRRNIDSTIETHSDVGHTEILFSNVSHIPEMS